jgi:uncharacterized membrane protein (DUF2068 family)
MDKKTSSKIASVILFVHGFTEITGAVGLLVLPNGFLSIAGFQGEQGKIIFMAVLSAIFGLSRLAAGCAIWSMKKWGIIFGMVLSAATMIGASSIYPFGVMDLLLATVVLVSLLYLWFGGEKL